VEEGGKKFKGRQEENASGRRKVKDPPKRKPSGYIEEIKWLFLNSVSLVFVGDKKLCERRKTAIDEANKGGENNWRRKKKERRLA